MRLIRNIIFVSVLLLCISSTTNADPITFTFSGTINRSTFADDLFNGEDYYAEVIVDSNAPDLNPYSTVGRYEPLSFYYAVGPKLDPIFSGTSSNTRFEVRNPGSPGMDGFASYSHSPFTPPQLEGYTITYIQIEAFSQDLWDTDALPLDPINFEPEKAFFGIFATKYVAGSTMQVEVTSGTLIPEPTTMLLLGTGLIGLAGVRRRKKK